MMMRGGAVVLVVVTKGRSTTGASAAAASSGGLARPMAATIPNAAVVAAPAVRMRVAAAACGRFRLAEAFSAGPAGASTDGLPPGTWHAVDRVRAWQKSSDAGHTLATLTNFAARANLLNTTSRLCVASGENFINNVEERIRVRDTARADAVDMNLYGLILACEDHRVPLTAWKIISDLADERAAESFQTFRNTYDGAGGAALADLILALPPDPADPLTHPAIERALREK